MIGARNLGWNEGIGIRIPEIYVGGVRVPDQNLESIQITGYGFGADDGKVLQMEFPGNSSDEMILYIPPGSWNLQAELRFTHGDQILIHRSAPLRVFIGEPIIENQRFYRIPLK